MDTPHSNQNPDKKLETNETNVHILRTTIPERPYLTYAGGKTQTNAN